MLLLVFAPLALALTTGTFTVDDDGPADFPGIVEALASPLVTPGSTLLVAAGSYGNFTLNKPLHILPQAGQGFAAGHVHVTSVERFSLVGAQMKTLHVSDVPGPSLIDRCQVMASDIGSSTLGFYFYSEAEFEDCAGLVVQRSAFRGTDGCYSDGPSIATEAIGVTRSTMTFVDCWIRGGNATGMGCDGHYPVSGSGVILRDSSDVLFAGCQVGGGEGAPGENMPALDVRDSCAIVRGTKRDSLHAALPALAVAMDAGSKVSVSGVVVLPERLPVRVVRPRPAEPFLRAVGGEGPGLQLRLDLFGPAGSLGVVAGSFGMQPRALAGVSETLWLDPSTLFLSTPMLLAGQNAAASLFMPMPAGPDVIGLGLVLQAWVDPALGAGPWLTNPVALVLGG